MGSSEIACGSANPRADVEQLHSRTQVHLRGDRFGSFAAANVEFVNDGEIVRRDAGTRLTGRFECRKNALFEICRCVMLRDADFGGMIACSHAGLPSFVCYMRRKSWRFPSVSGGGTENRVNDFHVREGVFERNRNFAIPAYGARESVALNRILIAGGNLF